VALGAAAGGHEDAIGAQGLVAFEVDEEAIVGGFDLLDGGAGKEFDISAAGGVHQAVDDGFGGVAEGEHTAIGFGFELDAFAQVPVDGVLGLKPCECASEGFATTGIVLDEDGGFEAGVGDVAAASARDADLGEGGASGFDEGDLGTIAGGFDGPKESCGSTTDDYDLHLMHNTSPRADVRL
jgi:hypothetical protein